VINRLIVRSDLRPMKFLFFERVDPLCKEYEPDCIDVQDFVLCAHGCGVHPPIMGVCPMLELL
jgi:hypothetical protein